VTKERNFRIVDNSSQMQGGKTSRNLRLRPFEGGAQAKVKLLKSLRGWKSNMPRLSDTMEEEQLPAWLKKVGDEV